MSLALHNYHDSNKSFPAGRWGPQCFCCSSTDEKFGHSFSWSGTFFSIPYMEQQAAYDVYVSYCQAQGGKAPVPWLNANTLVNADFTNMVRAAIPALICPSDSNSKTGSKNNQQAKTNYALCRGDSCYDNNEPNGTQRGLFCAKQWHDISACSDGTSNTAIISEYVVHTNTHWTKLRRKPAMVPYTVLFC
ncbi:MAG: DUF1559 domain-containing protein [Planctomycetaceae bacterium]|nr:DUF1559 domain-containing protein [Planctomycetaceae bacterium]